MRNRESPGQGNCADARAWLEEAIFSSNAALSPASSSLPTIESAMNWSGASSASSETADMPANTVVASADFNDNNLTVYKRKLVTVRHVTAVDPFASKIYNIVTIDGWKAAVRKDKELLAGQYALYFEVDSFIPATPDNERLFLTVVALVDWDGQKGFRVGTDVFFDEDGNEVVTQGQVFPLTDFPDIYKQIRDLHYEHLKMTEAEFADLIRPMDFSDELGVVKWEAFPDLLEPISKDSKLEVKESKEEDNKVDNKGTTKTPIGRTTVNMPAWTPESSSLVPGADKNKAEIPTIHPKAPSFLVKTSMERVQNCPNLFDKPKYKRFVFQESLKKDGATISIYFIPHDSPLSADLPVLPTLHYDNQSSFLRYALHPNGRFGVCSSNFDLLPHLLPNKSNATHNVYWTTALAANLHKLLPELNQPLAIQAELVGASIQANPYAYPTTPGGPTHELFVFTILDLHKSGLAKRRDPRAVESFCNEHGLQHVPVCGYHTLHDVARGYEDLIARAELKKGEGLVYKNCTDGRWFKILSDRWIREKGDEMHARKQLSIINGKGKGVDKGKVALPVGDRVVVQEGGTPNYQAPPEAVAEMYEIANNLEEWIEKDAGVRWFMSHFPDWRPSDGPNLSARRMEVAGDMDLRGGEEGDGVDTVQKDQSGSQNGICLEYSIEERKDMADWLGLSARGNMDFEENGDHDEHGDDLIDLRSEPEHDLEYIDHGDGPDNKHANDDGINGFGAAPLTEDENNALEDWLETSVATILNTEQNDQINGGISVQDYMPAQGSFGFPAINKATADWLGISTPTPPKIEQNSYLDAQINAHGNDQSTGQSSNSASGQANGQSNHGFGYTPAKSKELADFPASNGPLSKTASIEHSI